MTRAPRFRVVLTGGIASGKTTVAGLFAARGVPVIDTDELARAVVEPGQPALARLVELGGQQILTADGRLDRRRMRAAVFADAQLRGRVEQILHPAIGEELERRAARVSGPYLIVVVPLYVETGGRMPADRVLVVDASPEAQLARLLKRDAETAAQAQAMLAAQVARERRLAHADDVIENDGDPAALQAQVEGLHETYLRLAGAQRPVGG